MQLWVEVAVPEFVCIGYPSGSQAIRYSGGIIEICSPYVCVVFRLSRYSVGLIEICSLYVLLFSG